MENLAVNDLRDDEDYSDLPPTLLAELRLGVRNRGGRPPISETKATILFGAFERGYRTAKAAKQAQVHRNTAITYFARFRAGLGLPAGTAGISTEFPVRLRQYVWKRIAHEAEARKMSKHELASKLLTIIVADNLFNALLSDDDDEE